MEAVPLIGLLVLLQWSIPVRARVLQVNHPNSTLNPPRAPHLLPARGHPLFFCAGRFCKLSAHNASLPCIRSDAEINFLIDLTGAPAGRPIITGKYQSHEAKSAEEGWEAWANGCESSWTGWHPEWSEPNWWEGNVEACAFANLDGRAQYSNRLADAPCDGRMVSACVCEGATPTAAFEQWLEELPGASTGDARTQLFSDFVPRTVSVLSILIFLSIFLGCLYCRGCAWHERVHHSKLELSDEELRRPRNCCGTIADHEAARKLHHKKRVDASAFTCIRGFGALQVAIGHYFSM